MYWPMVILNPARIESTMPLIRINGHKMATSHQKHERPPNESDRKPCGFNDFGERETGLEPATYCLKKLYAKEIVEWRSKLL